MADETSQANESDQLRARRERMAGGGSGTHTSYDGPIVVTKTEPGVTVRVGGYVAAKCGCCGSTQQLALNVGTFQVISTESETRNFYVWAGG